jgi:hypothetical protein
MDDRADPGYSRIVTQEKSTIVTARPLTLTQDTTAPEEYFQVPPNTDLEVFGDEVTIRGRIEALGKTIKIFARVLTLEGVKTPSGVQPAELIVDGKEGAGLAAIAALPEGKKGDPGFNDCIEPFASEGCQKKGGGFGQSADPDYSINGFTPGDSTMHGKPGEPGKQGGIAGSIFVLCDGFFPPDQPLILSAKGGRGGKGQEGQGGAKGGDGGDGSNAAVNVGFMSGGHKIATWGGNGGVGGNGGRGGRGGDGGEGGRIVFRCVNAKNLPGDKIIAFVDGGSKGDPGAGGKAGAAGNKGRGGAGVPWSAANLTPSWDGADGREGRKGDVGESGSDGADGYVERSLNAAYLQLKSVLQGAFK